MNKNNKLYFLTILQTSMLIILIYITTVLSWDTKGEHWFPFSMVEIKLTNPVQTMLKNDRLMGMRYCKKMVGCSVVCQSTVNGVIHLSTMTIVPTYLEQDAGRTYDCWTSTPYPTPELQPDGLYYIKVFGKVDLTKTMTACNRIPGGFRLGMIKTTETLEVFKQYTTTGDYHIDLSYTAGGYFLSDGTPFGFTTSITVNTLNSGRAYVMFQGLFFVPVIGDFWTSLTFPYLCQANFDNIPW